MSSAHDDVDGVLSDALTVAATTGATVAAAHAAHRREQIEAARRAGTPVARRGWRNVLQFDRGGGSWSPRNPGKAEATVWTCDFSFDYVKINAEYRT
jgi:hypothetical protein